MKKIIILLLCMLAAGELQAQRTGEILQQKKTQKKYLLEQIAALQIYIGYAQKGYKIAKQGLDFIGDMKEGELNLHKDYFSSLKAINPSVKSYPKVEETKGLQVAILKKCKTITQQLQQGNMIRTEEMDYIRDVFDRLLGSCSDLIGELSLVMSANELEMKDDERIRRIDRVHASMIDNYTFIQSFGNEAILLAAARKKELHNTEASRVLNGLKN